MCSTHIDLFAAAVSGFLLMGPVFGAGFYALSQLRAAGKPATFDASLDGAVKNCKPLVYLGLVLAVLAIAWVWLSRSLFERACAARDLRVAHLGDSASAADLTTVAAADLAAAYQEVSD
jgi:hypothetical protein